MMAAARTHWERARDMLEPVFSDLKDLHSTADGLMRSVAYNLHEVLLALGLREKGQLLATQFSLLPLEDLAYAPWFQFSGEGSGICATIWPTTWTTPLRISDPSDGRLHDCFAGKKLSLQQFYDEPRPICLYGTSKVIDGMVELRSLDGEVLWRGIGNVEAQTISVAERGSEDVITALPLV